MRKLIVIGLIILGLTACGINCSGKPPKRAYIHSTGGMGMQYHVSIYIPGSGVQHSPRCPSYDYAKIDIYTDSLGNLRGDEVIWNNSYGEVGFTDYGIDPKNIQLLLSSDKVVVTHWDDVHNGTYKVETSSPASWGVSIY